MHDGLEEKIASALPTVNITNIFLMSTNVSRRRERRRVSRREKRCQKVAGEHVTHVALTCIKTSKRCKFPHQCCTPAEVSTCEYVRSCVYEHARVCLGGREYLGVLDVMNAVISSNALFVLHNNYP